MPGKTIKKYLTKYYNSVEYHLNYVCNKIMIIVVESFDVISYMDVYD